MLRTVSDSKSLVAGYLGVAVAGSQTDSGAIGARFANGTGGKPEATPSVGKDAGRELLSYVPGNFDAQDDTAFMWRPGTLTTGDRRVAAAA